MAEIYLRKGVRMQEVRTCAIKRQIERIRMGTRFALIKVSSSEGKPSAVQARRAGLEGAGHGLYRPRRRQRSRRDVVRSLGITGSEIGKVAVEEQQELERRDRLYRSSRPALDVRERIVILVADGAATGATMRAAIANSILRASSHRPPFRACADEVVFVSTRSLSSPSTCCTSCFLQTSDAKVLDLLERVEQTQSVLALESQEP